MVNTLKPWTMALRRWTMKIERGIGGAGTVRDYVEAVAREVHADSIDWWDMESVDVVLVLPFRLQELPERSAVLSWNRNFGWFLGVEGLGSSVVVIDGLGIGRMPSPAQCAERAIELIDDYCRSTPTPTSALPGAPVAVSDPPPTTSPCRRIGTEVSTQGRRDRVIRRPYLGRSRRNSGTGADPDAQIGTASD